MDLDKYTSQLRENLIAAAALGDEKTQATAAARVDVRKTESEEEPHPTFEEVTGDISRVTLRLVEQLKSRAEEAAAQSGQSLNGWLSSTVQSALRDQMKKGGGHGRWTPPGE